MNLKTILSPAVLAVAVTATPALAQDYTHNTPGIGGYDPVAYFTDGKPVKGNGYHVADFEPVTTKSMKGWSGDDHIAAATSQEHEAHRLTKKVQKLIQRISVLTQKPYLDPKELRRDSLKRISGNLIGKLRSLQKETAWHYEQAAQLTTLNAKHQNEG